MVPLVGGDRSIERGSGTAVPKQHRRAIPLHVKTPACRGAVADREKTRITGGVGGEPSRFEPRLNRTIGKFKIRGAHETDKLIRATEAERLPDFAASVSDAVAQGAVI